MSTSTDVPGENQTHAPRGQPTRTGRWGVRQLLNGQPTGGGTVGLGWATEAEAEAANPPHKREGCTYTYETFPRWNEDPMERCPACGSPDRDKRWRRNLSRNGGRWCSDEWHERREDYMPLRPVRRFGSSVTHLASYGDELRTEARIAGSDAVLIDAPLVAMCGAVLRGDVVEMSKWQTECQPCGTATKRAGLARPVSHSGRNVDGDSPTT